MSEAAAEMSEVDFEADKPATKKKPAKKKGRSPPRRASFQKPGQPPADRFPGLTRTACAETCSAAACAISGKPYCAHPTKGGLQAADAENRAAIVRLQEARDQIGVRIDPDRFK